MGSRLAPVDVVWVVVDDDDVDVVVLVLVLVLVVVPVGEVSSAQKVPPVKVPLFPPIFPSARTESVSVSWAT